ncbi:MAG: aldo/keto reductase [Acetatifactor sp.]|nr:aldo/keto reductase [Acetatifactor sp.]
MEMRDMGKTGAKVSLLGFGCMRFPTTEDGKIDEARAEEMLDKAIASGVNYIDTAYPYHGGESERFVGKVLQKYDRDSFYLATKLPVWLVKSLDDVDRIFEEQLQKLRTDHVDFYLMHALDREVFERMRDMGVVEKLKEMKKAGKFKYLGFSFHDEYSAFEEIINYTDWDFCQIQLNYMDADEQAGVKGYELAKKKDVPLVIMEPVKGGTLANLAPDIKEKFAALDKNASVASYALRWVGTFDNVKVILSGMSTMEQVEDNLNTFIDFKPLTDKEKETIDDVVSIMKSRVQNGCTGCRYCMPCPFGVDIPGCFKAWNTYHVYGNYNSASWLWEHEIGEAHQAKNCKECGACEQKCPQHLSIRSDLKKAQADLDKKEFRF